MEKLTVVASPPSVASSSSRASAKAPPSASRVAESRDLASNSSPSEAASTTSAATLKNNNTTKGDIPYKKGKATTLSPIDMDVLRSLEHEYSSAAQESHLHERARRLWARKAASYSVVFMLVYFVIGVAFFQSQTDWSLPDTILFAMYTATSAGYGHVPIPRTVAFHLFDIVYILIGIAAMAIMVAQVYQFVQLEAAQVHNRRKAAELAAKSTALDTRTKLVFWAMFDRFRPFFEETMYGRILAVLFPCLAVLLTGSLTVGKLEGWSFTESVYFGVVSMTFVGYGDYFPRTLAGILITTFWLPFNAVFTSLYMGSVAKWYLNLSANGTKRIRDALHTKTVTQATFARSISSPTVSSNRSKFVAIEVGLCDYLYEEDEDLAASEVPETATDPDTTDNQSEGRGNEEEDPNGPMTIVLENLADSTLTTMKDVIQAIHTYGDTPTCWGKTDEDRGSKTIVSSESHRFMTIDPESAEKPGFALRVLVTERLAAIIARDIAGGRHMLDVQDSFIVVRIGQWKEVVAKWHIPSGAWKAFRATALEVIMLVGEHDLIAKGPDALFSLSPDQFHSMFSPVVAAMGEAKTLKGWLTRTDQLVAEEQLYYSEGYAKLTAEALQKKHCKLSVADEAFHMPKSQATAFH